MRAQYADALISCNKYRQINYQLPNEVISLHDSASRACAMRRLAEDEASSRLPTPPCGMPILVLKETAARLRERQAARLS
jgi:hypothetical protein